MSKDKEYETWKRLGDELKDIEKRLSAIICNPSYQKLLGVRIQNQLFKVGDRIKDIKSTLEDRMFAKVRPTRDDRKPWLNIFFGGTNGQGGDA